MAAVAEYKFLSTVKQQWRFWSGIWEGVAGWVSLGASQALEENVGWAVLTGKCKWSKRPRWQLPRLLATLGAGCQLG